MKQSNVLATTRLRISADQLSSTVLLPIMLAVFVAFLVVGLALPVLPLHVHQTLGLGTFMVGLVAGSQFAAAILSRILAGRHSDKRGPKRAVVIGLLIVSTAGLLYFLSFRFAATPAVSVAILLVGRMLLGVGESFIITGAQSWGLALIGVENTSRALAWVGSAMFAALALGAPVGTTIYAHFGFGAVALATTLLPLATLLFVVPLRSVPSVPRPRTGVLQVMAAVWLPGVGAALSSVGFGAIAAFSALLFAARGWAPWAAFTAFATTFIVTRIALSHVADRFGGAKVALVFSLVEAAGLALIWQAPWIGAALLGAGLTGMGYSLVYPGLGVEAIHCAPAESRGLAMGAYTAFLDLALGFGTPALGFLAGIGGLGAAFAASMIAALAAAAVAAALLHHPQRRRIVAACP